MEETQCTHIREDGTRCRGQRTGEGTTCFAHTDPERWKKASAVNRLGKTNDRMKISNVEKIEKPDDVREILASLIIGYVSGTIPAQSRLAGSIGYLCKTWNELNESIAFGQQLQKIEERISELESRAQSRGLSSLRRIS